MKNRYLIFISIIFAAILLFVLTFFPDRNNSGLKLNGPIPVILKANTSKPFDFWSVVKRGVEEASREFSIDLYITGPELEKDKDMQMVIMDKAILENPPFIILAASDYEDMVPYVRKAQRAGIPIITVDSGVNSDIPVSFIATDNLEAGRKAGYAMSELLSEAENKKFAIVSYVRGTATAIDREAGVIDSMGDLEFLETRYCEGDREKAYNITIQLMNDYPDLAGIIALNEPAALGVAQAIDETNSKDRIVVVGFDNAPGELEYLEQNIMKAIVIQRPFNMGYLSIKTAYEYLMGEKVDSFINTGSLLITADNMYHQELQEVLFPFGN